MGRMDVSALRYLSKDELRTLQAVEQGMKNHDLVPVELISSIANLKHGGAFKALGTLLRAKLLRHDRKKYDGYSLNYLGYDYLAFSTLAKRNVVKAMGRQIGVGKESDVFIALDETEEKTLVVKMHRLGRTSFRKVKEKRDYHQHRKFANWLYLSHLAAEKEFAFMKILRDAGFPVPEPIDCNRHCVVMSLVDAYPLTQIRELAKPGKVFAQLMELHIRLAQCGLVHCDFNEFNVMINDNEELTMIDFPQMVSTSHKNAAYYFNRDVECLRLFFERRYGFSASSVPTLADCTTRIMELDKLAAASGFTKEDTSAFDDAMESYRQSVGKPEDDHVPHAPFGYFWIPRRSLISIISSSSLAFPSLVPHCAHARIVRKPRCFGCRRRRSFLLIFDVDCRRFGQSRPGTRLASCRSGQASPRAHCALGRGCWNWSTARRRVLASRRAAS